VLDGAVTSSGKTRFPLYAVVLQFHYHRAFKDAFP
jgi:hypothetical protein